MGRYGRVALIEDIARETTGLSERQIAQVLDAAIGIISTRLAEGQGVTLTGFGTFRRVTRAPRRGRHIRTGETIDIPRRYGVSFAPGSALKARLRIDR